MLPEEGSLQTHSAESDQQKLIQLQEKLISIQQNCIDLLEKQKQLLAQIDMQNQLLEQKQERIHLLEQQIELQDQYKQNYQAALEKQNHLQAQVDSQKQLLATRHEYISLLENENHSQAQQITAFSAGSQNAPGQASQAKFSTPLSPVISRFRTQPGNRQQQQKNGKTFAKQPGRALLSGGRTSRFPVVVILILLVLVLLGGGSIGIYHAISGHQPGSTPIPTLDTTSPGKQFSQSSPSLSIQSSTGLDCADFDTSVAFASNRLTYNNAELQKMEDYYNAYFAEMHINSFTVPPLPLPSMLLGVGDRAPVGVCSLNMQITNTSDAQVQIIQGGIQISQVTPYVNSQKYHLIDPCTIVANCPSGGSGGGACGLYSLQIKLEQLPQVGKSYTQDYQAQNGCGLPVISAHQSIDFELRVSSGFSSPPGNVSFTMIPEITEKTGAGTDHITLSQMTGTQKFVDPKAFSCYGWNGSAFVLEDAHASNVIVIDHDPAVASCKNNFPNA